MPRRTVSRARHHCPTSKVFYPDDIAATLALEKVQLRARREIHFENRTYKCNLCKGWHLTSHEQYTVPRIAHSA